MRAEGHAFIGALIYEHPWFIEMLQEHLDFYDGLLPHLFIADVERWAEAKVSAGSADDRAQLSRVLAFLEAGFGRGPEIAELISVSFLEHLPRHGEPNSELRALVGRSCREQLSVIG